MHWYKRMRPKSCINYATLKTAYHDESPWEKAGQPHKVLQDGLYLHAGNVQAWWMLLHRSHSAFWCPSKKHHRSRVPTGLFSNSQPYRRQYLFIPSIVTLNLLCMKQCAGPLRHTSKQTQIPDLLALWLLTSSGEESWERQSVWLQKWRRQIHM